MSAILLHAVLPACMDVSQILKIDIFSKRLLYKFLGGRPLTETTGIILVCFDGKYTRAYKKALKLKVCLQTYYIAGHLKQPRGPWVGQPWFSTT